MTEDDPDRFRIRPSGREQVPIVNAAVDPFTVTVAKAFGVPVPLLVEPTPEQAARRAAVLAAAQDAGSEFIYYGRKEDEELPLGAIQAAVDAGDVTREEIVEAFTRGMEW